MLRATIAVVRGRPRRRRRDHGAAVHRGARPAGPLRAPGRAQHAAHPARRIEPRQGRRSRRGLRRHRGPDRQALRAPPGRCSRRSRRPAALRRRSKQGLIQGKVAAYAPSAQTAVAQAQRPADRHQRVPESARSSRSRCSTCRQSQLRADRRQRRFEPLPPMRLAEPFEALRDASDRDAGNDRRAAEGLSRQSRQGRPISPRARRSPRISSRPAASKRSTSDGFKSRDEMIAAFKASGAKLACLCSSDKIYETRSRRRRQGAERSRRDACLSGRPARRTGSAAAAQAGVADLHLSRLRRAGDACARRMI